MVHKDRGFDRALANLLDLAQQAIVAGLATPVINMSYAGNPEVVRRKRIFADFERYAQARGIELMLSVMSTTAGINVGPGAFALAYIAGPPVAIPATTTGNGNSREANLTAVDDSQTDWSI